ncbi:hypothetical protein PIB30_059548 [Stylosanthes scabra]|uniref:DUF4283 domain-containing protein n=1 Tax=Stylosanthes scabra TaxID=79078 RepID=A0ABU6VMQ9_9FABA|nr:hypothetical protein [Stylosanthes scabra]
MGMPVKLWCVANFENIAEQWGKVVRYDDRAEEEKSFSIARILIDSFQWKFINEWISVKADDYVFDVLVKEVGAEVYSVQSHPDRNKDELITYDNSRSVTAKETVREVAGERSPTSTNNENLNPVSINAGRIDATILDEANNGIGSDVHEDAGVTGSRSRKTVRQIDDREKPDLRCRSGAEMKVGFHRLDWDPMLLEAQ